MSDGRWRPAAVKRRKPRLSAGKVTKAIVNVCFLLESIGLPWFHCD